MADGDPYNAGRPCRHHGCRRTFPKQDARRLYCDEHRSGLWVSRRQRTAKREATRRGRPEEVIRADLAAQLGAQVRRFNSMVAHDRATDPLRCFP